MINRIMLLLLAVLVAVCVTSCARREPQGLPPDVTLNLAVTPDPPSVGPSTLTLTITWTATISKSTAGVYSTPFAWTMGGDWVVSVDVTLADGRSFSQQFNFSVKGGM